MHIAATAWHASAVFTLARLIERDPLVLPQRGDAHIAHASALEHGAWLAWSVAVVLCTSVVIIFATAQRRQNSDYAAIQLYAAVISAIFACVAATHTISLTLDHAYTAHTCLAIITAAVYISSSPHYHDGGAAAVEAVDDVVLPRRA